MIDRPSQEQLLRSIQKEHKFHILNNTTHDVRHLIAHMEIVNPEPPDYKCGEDIYIEHFEVDAYKRVPNTRSQKMASVHLSDEAKIERLAQKHQNVFSTTHYRTPPHETSTRHLKENVSNLIEEKTQKQANYEKNCPDAKSRHLLIELKARCELVLDNQGQYIDGARVDTATRSTNTELYEVYRDLTFMTDIQQKYSDRWDLLLFVQEYNNLGVHVYNIYCMDLKEEIVSDNMKAYPETMLQHVSSGTQTVKIVCGNSTTNVRYALDRPNKDALSNFLWSYTGDALIVNGILLEKSEHPSVYISSDGALQFETSQKALAISPDEDDAVIANYVPLLLLKSISLDCGGTLLELRRDTPIGAYYKKNGDMAYYRVDKDRVICFELAKD